MSEQIDDLTDTPLPRLGGRNDSILLALGETRSDAKRAADTSTRVEAAVGGLVVRVGALEVDFASFKAAAAARDIERTRAEASRREENGPKTPAVVWISLAISALMALLILLDHLTPASGG